MTGRIRRVGREGFLIEVLEGMLDGAGGLDFGMEGRVIRIGRGEVKDSAISNVKFGFEGEEDVEVVGEVGVEVSVVVGV